MKITVFWDVALCSLVEAHRHFEWKSIFKIENTLKMEAERIYEMSKNFHQTTQHQLPEDNIHHGLSHKDPKCHIIYLWLV